MSKYWKVENGKGMVQFDDDVEVVCEQFCANIVELIHRAEAQNKRLQEQNRTLTDEHFKDKHIQEMQNELQKARDDLYRGFPISADEMERIHMWQNAHLKEQHGYDPETSRGPYGGAIGGSWTYEFVPTSIGTFATCVCGTCRRNGQPKEIAEFDFQEP